MREGEVRGMEEDEKEEANECKIEIRKDKYGE